MAPRDNHKYEIRRNNRWIGWSNTFRSAVYHAKRVPPVAGFPVYVVNRQTGAIVWSAGTLNRKDW